MPKTAFITGITGQDGSYLAELLLTKGYRVVGLARRSTNYHYPNIAHLAGRIELEYGDLLDTAALAAIIQRQQPDEVYHLAAQSVPGDSWNQPLVTGEITALGTVRMLEAVRLHKPDARFYQATSREIYGGVAEEVVDEDTPFHANNPYGIAKLYAHQMAVNYRESWGMFACAGMLFNHESPRPWSALRHTQGDHGRGLHSSRHQRAATERGRRADGAGRLPATGQSGRMARLGLREGIR